MNYQKVVDRLNAEIAAGKHLAFHGIGTDDLKRAIFFWTDGEYLYGCSGHFPTLSLHALEFGTYSTASYVYELTSIPVSELVEKSSASEDARLTIDEVYSEEALEKAIRDTVLKCDSE